MPQGISRALVGKFVGGIGLCCCTIIFMALYYALGYLVHELRDETFWTPC